MWPRRLAAVALTAVALFLLNRGVFVPWRCNVLEAELSRSTEAVWEKRQNYAARAAAEENLRRLEECHELCGNHINLLMFTGANLLVLQRNDAAAAAYQRALEIQHRPEIYAALGDAQVAAGEREKALESYVLAGRMGGSKLLATIPDGEIKVQAFRRVDVHRTRIVELTGKAQPANRVSNSRFAQVGPRGKRLEAAKAGLRPSAAANWQMLNSTADRVVTEIIASTRRGGRALRVAADAPGNGIVQTIAHPSQSRMLVTAWVYVVRGSVSAGAGAESVPAAGTFSNSTGRWERLVALNDTCPARNVALLAGTPDTEFYVDEVTVTPAPLAPRCDE